MVEVEAEEFEDYGGWVSDTQFMDQMGSPYLLAHGLGKPVADAKTRFKAKGGKYNVWVRTKNWTAPWHPDIGAGTFNLVVNGEKLPNLLGCQGKGEWLWVKADDVTLKDGENTLALHDCDGFDGRVDAIVFSTSARPVLPMPRELVRDYTVEVRLGGAWRTVAKVSENLMRHRIHEFPSEDVDAVRVTVDRTWGDPLSRILEIRVY